MDKLCAHCGIRKTKRKYCSHPCYALAIKSGKYPHCGFRKGHGNFLSAEVIEKKFKGKHFSPTTQFRRGQVPWNKGKKHPKVAGEKNGFWKGAKVGYFALHTWVERNYGRAWRCENREKQILWFSCSMKSNTFQWANISGKYLRDRSDWMMICVSCHSKYDHPKNQTNKIMGTGDGK